METPKFNNKPNAHVRYNYNDGSGVKIDQDFWISRSTAIVGVVLASTRDGLQILITKRSKKMRDEANKVGVTCGYLDWGETRYEAMIREVYEETSLYLPEYEKMLIYNNNQEAIIIKDNPNTDKRQNVSHIFLSVFDFTDCPDKFPLFVELYSSKETAWVKWMKLLTFYETYTNYDWAFHHDETIINAIKFFNKNFERK